MVEINVVIDDLRSHAENLKTDIVPDVEMAVQAASSVSAASNADAYGKLCAPILVPMMSSIEQATILAMKLCKGATERFANASNLLANVIDACDIDNEKGLGKTGIDLVPAPTIPKKP